MYMIRWQRESRQQRKLHTVNTVTDWQDRYSMLRQLHSYSLSKHINIWLVWPDAWVRLNFGYSGCACRPCLPSPEGWRVCSVFCHAGIHWLHTWLRNVSSISGEGGAKNTWNNAVQYIAVYNSGGQCTAVIQSNAMFSSAGKCSAVHWNAFLCFVAQWCTL